MATYVLGAGASFHAGYPLCSELWSRMATWVIETSARDSEYRQAVDLVAVLNGPVSDVEEFFTDLDLGRNAFCPLTEGQRDQLKGRIRRCVGDYFNHICKERREARLYGALAKTINRGDVFVTFNYDVSLENELIQAKKFSVRDGYGPSLRANWDEPDSAVTVLKPHGSTNWVSLLFRSSEGSLGAKPFVNNNGLIFADYPDRILDKALTGGGIAEFTTLVLPTFEKVFSVTTSLGPEYIPFYESLWLQSATSLEHAERIVVIGYSMPEADYRARAILLWNANKQAEVFVCCGSSNETVKTQFKSHGFGRVRDMGSFENLLASGSL